MTETIAPRLSFASPSSRDLAAWDALSLTDKQAIARRELAAPATAPQPLTAHLRYTIFARALADK